MRYTNLRSVKIVSDATHVRQYALINIERFNIFLFKYNSTVHRIFREVRISDNFERPWSFLLDGKTMPDQKRVLQMYDAYVAVQNFVDSKMFEEASK